MTTGQTAERPTCCGQVERQGIKVPAEIAIALDRDFPGWRELSKGEVAFVLAAYAVITKAKPN